jgi:ATP-dependent DNA helicase RecG
MGIGNKKTRRRGFTVTEAVVEDGTGSVKVVWFNQPYLAKMLRAGSEVILNGKVSIDPYSGELVMESPNRANKPKIVPVYGETAGLSSYFIARQITNIKSQIINVKEFLPEKVIEQNKLLGIQQAILNIHQPKNSEMLEKAREKLSFDELFLISMRANLARLEIKHLVAPKISADISAIKKMIKNLPFELTPDQKKALWQIIKDLEQNTPMNRLLDGDVGSGKTAVAALASYLVALSGYRTLLMAPTEILANQHFKTFEQIYKNLPYSIGLYTSANKKLNSNDSIIIGTHALIYEKANFSSIGLVIVDEQHRFGVKQRELLKNQKSNKKPHFLSMTATPIPRTLYLALFADLDLSVIKTMPKGRKEIKTRVVPELSRDRAYDFIREQIKKGRQAFVICPLIEDKQISNSKLQVRELFEQDRKSVIAEYQKLDKNIFPDLNIGMLHGRMKAKEKEEIMANFKANRLNILVSTSVVEVGVDIPNATIMMIEDAERFGLAGLHQFRGRVGRAKHQSFCFLFSNSKNLVALNRLQAMEETSDGFKLAEIDLKNRGAGDIFGTLQSGEINLKMASLSDRILIEKASNSAKEIVTEGIDKYPQLLEALNQLESSRHNE